MPDMLHALSFDVEEWYHAEIVRQRVPPNQRVSQIEAAVEPILALLDRRTLKATFFVVGEVVRDHPALVRAIAAAGHEIGCHTMTHRPLWQSSPEELRGELRSFREALETATPGAGGQVIGFRAPTFSLNQSTAWALAVLAGEGYLYDSSIFPAANPVYGLNGGPLGVYRPSVADLRSPDSTGNILEMPMTVWSVAGQRIPVSGGFYLRAVPWPILHHALMETARQRPVVLYMHPWEAYDRTPIVQGLSPLDHFITYHHRSQALPRLERILDDLPFAPLSQVLAHELAAVRVDAIEIEKVA